MMVLPNIQNKQKSYFHAKNLKPGDRPNNGNHQIYKISKSHIFRQKSSNLVTNLTMVLPNIQNKQKSYFQAEKLRPGDRPNNGITKYTK